MRRNEFLLRLAYENKLAIVSEQVDVIQMLDNSESAKSEESLSPASQSHDVNFNVSDTFTFSEFNPTDLDKIVIQSPVTISTASGISSEQVDEIGVSNPAQECLMSNPECQDIHSSISNTLILSESDRMDLEKTGVRELAIPELTALEVVSIGVGFKNVSTSEHGASQEYLSPKSPIINIQKPILFPTAISETSTSLEWDKKDSQNNEEDSYTDNFQDFENSGSEYIPSSGPSFSSIDSESSDYESDMKSECSKAKGLSYVKGSQVHKVKQTYSRSNFNLLHSKPKNKSALPVVTNNMEIDNKLRSKDIHQKYIKKSAARERPTICPICYEDVITHFSRHLFRHHANNKNVKVIQSLKPGCKERLALVAALRKQGYFHLNIEKNILNPVRTSKDSKTKYFVCTYCLGHYTKKLLYKHVKHCKNKPVDVSKSGRNCLSKSQTFMALTLSKNHEYLMTSRIHKEVFEVMRADDISAAAKNDPLICLYGETLLAKHKRQQIATVVSSRIREMARLLLVLKSMDNDVSGLFDTLRPEMFRSFILATKIISGYNENKKSFKAPSLALHMGTNLKIVCNVAFKIVMEKRKIPNINWENRDQKKSDIKDLRKLIEGHWCNEISSLALKTLKERQWEKPVQLPLTNDILAFQTYVNELAENAYEKLNNNIDIRTNYKVLTECVLAQTVMFNRKRVGDVQFLKIETYNKDNCGTDQEAFTESLTAVEKLISKKFKRVITGGKGSKPVAILFPRRIQKFMSCLLTIRGTTNVVPKSNPYIFANPGSDERWMAGANIIRRFAKNCGAKQPTLLTSTKFRKHIATTLQLMNMQPDEMEQIATFMGHTKKTHDEFYRLPQDIYQTAKVAKVLLLLEKGKGKEFRGKTLSEIQLEKDIYYSSESDENEDLHDMQPLSERLLCRNTDAVFTSGYTFGAPTPPPGSPYSPVPVAQLELLTKGFGSNIVIQQPEYSFQSRKPPFVENTLLQQLCEEKCCSSKAPQKSCICGSSPSSTTNTARTKFTDNISGCSRTNPIQWGTVTVKKEPGTPCQVAEITTSVLPMVKLEATSPITQRKGVHDHSNGAPPVVTTTSNIPVGIAVARQRIQQHDIVSSPSLPPTGLLATVNTSTQIKEIPRMPEIDSMPGMAANVTGGVSTNGGALMQCTDDRSPGLAGWPVGSTHGSALTTPTLWQYPASLPMDPVVPMSLPMPPVGYQLVRDPSIGGFLLLPTTEPLHQAVVWPSYPQPPSHVLLPQIPPPPLQLLSSASSDYLSSSTTLHQHTQTHSTRLVAVTTDTKRKIPLPVPTTTLIKIEADATALDQTKTLQAVSTVASNTATVFTDQSVAPLVTTHVIYQHPTNLILSQTPIPEIACRSQATSPVTCLTPPPENNVQNEVETLGVQDASNQTELPISSEDDTTLMEEIKSKNEEGSKYNVEEELPSKVPENIANPAEAISKVLEQVGSRKQNNEVVSFHLANSISFQDENQPVVDQVKPDSTQEKLEEQINLRPDLSGLELLSSIVEFQGCRKNFEKVIVKQETEEFESEENGDVLNAIGHMTLKDHGAQQLSKKLEDSFGGLDLLCALAEQRILEEVTDKHNETAKVCREEVNVHARKKEKRKFCTHRDESEYKKNKDNLEGRYNIKHFDKKKYEKFNRFGFIEMSIRCEDKIVHSREVNKNYCSCKTEESYRTYKTRESEEEVKKFIASKSQSLCCKGDWPCMNQNELDMRKKLADLQRKYREKQRELHKLKAKKHIDQKYCVKRSKLRKKSIHNSKGRETPPPPLLDKMDMPIKPNKNNQELLRPPTLCAYSNDDIKSTKLLTNKESQVDDKREHVDSSPFKHCCSSNIDFSDNTPEKTFSSSKKRKVGRPRKLLTSSGLRTGTETIVAKKPKKGIVGYLLAAKQKLVQSKNKQLFSNSPPRFVEEIKEFSKSKPQKNRNDDAHNKQGNDKKNEKPKMRPKLKAEPMVKENTEEEEMIQEWSKDIISSEVNSEETQQIQENEKIEADNEIIEACILKDQKCILTSQHLEIDKLRVLTAMGGLFYAGHLNAVEPPDVYSIILDGERGNRPHIMSREEILRDAIVEVAPTSTSELLVGTRICAYWSQQYRCLYPGSVAEPGTPDPALDFKFVSVEFDDGDSGRIALEDIRLLPPDYPIIEYDPNPLLSLSKRRRRTSTAEDKQRLIQVASATTRLSILPQEVSNQHTEKENQDRSEGNIGRNKERKRLKKRKKEKLKNKVSHEDKKRRRKHKCSDDNCKHKKHKKHRKHKKHHHNKKVGEEDAFETICKSFEDKTVEAENKQDSFKEASEEYEHITNPEDEVTMDDILDDKKKKSKKIRDRQESCESRSKMSAFLPARQLWGWSGKSYKRPKRGRRMRKEFYKAIQRGKETILVGDSAVFLSTGRPDRPYIGKIEAMWETCGTMVVRVKWFYHPEETVGCPPSLQYPGALFESPHVDENDVQTISHKCEVLPLQKYREKLGNDPQRYATIYDNNDIYYLAGYYDPTTTTLKIEPGIPF